MGRLVFVTGPVRSGKSRIAQQLAEGWGPRPVYVATYRPDPTDEEMGERIRRHRADRSEAWRTLEAPEDIGAALGELQPAPTGVMLDCLTLWLGGRMDGSDERILDNWRSLLERLKAAPHATVIVGNEVGWAPVPVEPELRRFRDLAGWLAQATAVAADEAWLCVAGCPLRLK